MTAEAPTLSTEKPRFRVGGARGPDGEIDYSKGLVPIGETLAQMEAESADQDAAKKAERDGHFADTDQYIADKEGTPTAVFYRIQKIREMNQGRFSDRQPDDRSRALDEKLQLEQDILERCQDDVRKNEQEYDLGSVGARLDSWEDTAHGYFERGDSLDSRLFGLGDGYIKPEIFISAAHDLQERLGQEQEKAQARKFGSQAAKQTVEH